jgi:AcrR family transcriptional regulator
LPPDRRTAIGQAGAVAPPSKRTGRRPGNPPTRDTILAAARRVFAEHGYSGATLRGVASEADVDVALVHHYFKGKGNLFAAATTMPPAFVELLPALLATPLDELGAAVVRAIVTIDEHPDALAAWTALVRSGTTDPTAAALLSDFLQQVILEPISERLGGADAPLRVSLVASQVLGLGIARHLIGIGPLAVADVEEVVAAVGPTIQRYLTGPLV